MIKKKKKEKEKRMNQDKERTKVNVVMDGVEPKKKVKRLVRKSKHTIEEMWNYVEKDRVSAELFAEWNNARRVPVEKKEEMTKRVESTLRHQEEMEKGQMDLDQFRSEGINLIEENKKKRKERKLRKEGRNEGEVMEGKKRKEEKDTIESKKKMRSVLIKEKEKTEKEYDEESGWIYQNYPEVKERRKEKKENEKK